MAFRTMKEMVDKIEDQNWSFDFRRISPNATSAGIWFDYSMATPIPKQNSYFSTALEAKALLYKDGIISGPDCASDEKKYLKMISAQCSVAPLNLMLCEYLIFYPGISGDDIAEEGITLDNSTASIPSAFNSVKDIQVMLVAQGSYTGGAQFYINYTNQDGVAGRISEVCTTNTFGIYGSILSSGVDDRQFGPFIPLQRGDTGVRSVEKVFWLTPNGGIAALVLVRKAGILDIREVNHPAEKDFFTDMGLLMPEIKNQTYINFLGLANATVAAAPCYGTVEFCWG